MRLHLFRIVEALLRISSMQEAADKPLRSLWLAYSSEPQLDQSWEDSKHAYLVYEGIRSLILEQCCRKFSGMEMGLLDHDDICWCLLCLYNCIFAGDVCPSAACQEGKLDVPSPAVNCLMYRPSRQSAYARKILWKIRRSMQNMNSRIGRLWVSFAALSSVQRKCWYWNRSWH